MQGFLGFFVALGTIWLGWTKASLLLVFLIAVFSLVLYLWMKPRALELIRVGGRGGGMSLLAQLYVAQVITFGLLFGVGFLARSLIG